MRITIILSVLFSILSQGCASLREVSSLTETTEDNIKILRNWNFFGAGIHYWPTVNGNDVAGLFVNQYVSFTLGEGEYSVGVRCFGGWWPAWWYKGINITITDPNIRYFMISPTILGCAEIEEITNEDGKDRLKSSTKLKTGTISNCNRVGVPFHKTSETSCLSNIIPNHSIELTG